MFWNIFRKFESSSGKSEDTYVEGKGLKLKRELGLFSGVGLIVGTIIGSGIFITPGRILLRTGSVGLSLAVWAVCGFISCLGGFCYIELGTLIPKSGGETSYLKAGLGNLPSFLFSWMRCLVIGPSSAAVLSLAFSEYVLGLVPVYYQSRNQQGTGNKGENPTSALCPETMDALKRLVAISALFLVTFVNCWSVRAAAWLQNTCMVCKVTALLVIIGGGVYNIACGEYANLTNIFEEVSDLEEPISVGSCAQAILIGMYAFDGWHQLNFSMEEVKDPEKTLPRAVLTGLSLVLFLYICVNISYLTVLSPHQIQTSSTVALEWGNVMLGDVSFLVPVSVALSTFGSLNGSMFAAGRVHFVAGREGHLPRVLSFANISRLTPLPALVFNATIAFAMICVGNIGSFIDVFSFTSFIFYGLVMVSLIVMRFTKKDSYRVFKVWIPIPILMILCSIFLFVTPLATRPSLEILYVGVFFLIGIILFWLFIFTPRSVPGTERLTRILQKMLNISPTKL